MITIYIQLRYEGIDCWIPVDAIEENGFFRILSTSDSEDEKWEFESGALVECEEKKFNDGTFELVVVRAIMEM